MNDTNTTEEIEIFTLPQDVLIELIQVLVMLRTQFEESGKSVEDQDCVNETIFRVSSLIIQNLINEKEKEGNVNCETTKIHK